MGFYEELLEEARGEIKARNSYRELSRRLEEAGFHYESNKVQTISSEEDRHSDLFMVMALDLQSEQGPEEIKLSGKMIEVKLERPFPKTYGDWVNLAEIIKEKHPDLIMSESVNFRLLHISNEDSLAEDSKRWLMEKADELGIK